MKKLGLVIFALASSSSMLAKHYGRAGCGLGSLVFKGNGKGEQILAATTNGTSGSQTFGITSATSNCIDSGVQARLVPFIQNNQVALENEAAKGAGESLAGLSSMMGCKDTAMFNQYFQANFENVFFENQSAEQLTNSIVQSARSNEQLRGSCQIFM